MRKRLTIGFGFTSDWLRTEHAIFKPVAKRSNAKTKQTELLSAVK